MKYSLEPLFFFQLSCNEFTANEVCKERRPSQTQSMIFMVYKYKKPVYFNLFRGPKGLDHPGSFGHQHCWETAMTAERELCAQQRNPAIKEELHASTLRSVTVQTTEQKRPSSTETFIFTPFVYRCVCICPHAACLARYRCSQQSSHKKKRVKQPERIHMINNH